MVLNLQANHSTDFATSTEYRMTSTVYNPTANGLAEAFNKTIVKILKKFISSSKRYWNEKLSECL